MVGLRAYVCDTEHHVLAYLTLNREVVLFGRLRDKVRREFAEKENRTECCPVYATRRPACTGARGLRSLLDHAPERVGSERPRNRIARLRQVRQIEVRVAGE